MGEYRAGKRIREALLSREQLLAELQSGRREFQVREFQVVYCEAAVAQSLAELAPELVAEPAAADACPLALERIRAGDFDDAATLDANYLRRTDAEIFAKPRPAEPAKILA